MLGRARQTLRVVAAGPNADDRHAALTAEILRRLGADEEVVTAGLLHDIAKPTGTRLWHRIGGVLLARFAPRVRRELARGGSTFARYIAGHHSPPRGDDARLLARADHEALP